MNTRKFFASFVAVSLVGTSAPPLSWAAAPAASLTSIGVAGAVKGFVQVMPSRTRRSAGRVISSGKPLYINEHVTTGPGGHLQIMLKDETVFTIGPNSDIVLDEFVYNPETEAGQVSASVTKGVFRFITGNIGKKDPSRMEVKLPAGTIGIRGTIVAGQVNPDGTSMAVLLGPGPAASGARIGAFNLSNSAGSVFVEKPGFGSTLRGDGVPPTPPTLIPVEQMKVLLGELTPKTVAQRVEEGRQMLAERVAQRMAPGEDEGNGKAPGKEGGRGMTEAERKIADKMVSGEALTPEEQAQVRQGMEKGHISETEKTIAEKMMAGENLTPAEQQKMGMIMAGEQMMEKMGPDKMTPEQMQLAEKMMTGNVSPDQQQQMMQKMSPDQRAMVGEMMPPPTMDAYRFEGGDPNGMIGGLPPMGPPPPGGMLGPYGGIGTFTGTPQFFQTFDPMLATNWVYIPPGGTTWNGGLPEGPTTWDAIRTQIVTGAGYYPARSGVFHMNTCGGGACVNPTGTWGFSNMLVDFGARTISGTANINAAPGGIVPAINDTATINVNFSALAGGAVIQTVGDTGYSNYVFQIGNAAGIPAGVLSGNATYNKAAGDVHGAGDPLISNKIDGAPPP